MKKLLLVCLLLTGCNTKPCKESEKYTIIQNNYKIENTKCIYRAQDDYAIFEKNGHKIYVNGSSVIIQE